MKHLSLIVIAMVALFVAQTNAATSHTFTLDVSSWDQKPTTITVAGDFNDWNKDATSLKRHGNVWSVAVPLSNGPHAYKFVADGERWLTDPKADAALETDDGNGGKNSGVNIGAAAAKAPAGFKFMLDTSAWEEKPKSVNLAGDFNGWNKEALLMHQDGNLWSASVPLDEGVHQYKFVIDGTRWITDPKADPALENDDGNGGHNSGVLVGPDARKMPPPKPNAVNTDAILFHPKEIADFNIVSDRTLRLRLRLQDGDAEHVYALASVSPTMAGATKTELHKLDAHWGFATYGGTIDVPSNAVGKTVNYAFEITDGTADVTWAGKSGASLTASLESSFVTPAWAEHAIWYQIFPERFRNGDPSNDPTAGADETPIRWTSKWFDLQPGEAAGAENFYYGKGNVWKRRYGGDIQGVQQALPYLKKLGITAIYLNPVFEAASMHKYDTTDYRHIDNHFGVKGDWPVAGETEDPATWKWSGSDKVFLDFVAEAHKQGMKVVIDGVFNHVGKPCPFFQDVLEHGKNSKYADWFEIVNWGDPTNWHKMDDPYSVHGKPGGIQWKAWDGLNGNLPAFKKNNETGLLAGPAALINGITQRWLAPDGDPSRGVDGFRLDAANEVPHPFWVQWRKLVKTTKPDAYISGEIWSPAQPWINGGDQFDAVMNYQFAMPTLDFFANNAKATTPSAFAKRLSDIIYMYPQQASLVMMNLFDSHDTDRLASMFVNSDRGYDAGNRVQDPDATKYDPRKPTAIERQRMMQAVSLQMTFLGAPMIYYGDEAGMWSADDPSDRQPMTWPELKFDDPQVGFDPHTFDTYRRLIAIRKALPALETGDFYPVASDDSKGTLVFARRTPTQVVYVAINRSKSAQSISFPTGEKDAGHAFINYADAGAVALADASDGDGHSTLTPKADAKSIKADHNTLTINVGPYDDAILAPKP